MEEIPKQPNVLDVTLVLVNALNQIYAKNEAGGVQSRKKLNN